MLHGCNIAISNPTHHPCGKNNKEENKTYEREKREQKKKWNMPLRTVHMHCRSHELVHPVLLVLPQRLTRQQMFSVCWAHRASAYTRLDDSQKHCVRHVSSTTNSCTENDEKWSRFFATIDKHSTPSTFDAMNFRWEMLQKCSFDLFPSFFTRSTLWMWKSWSATKHEKVIVNFKCQHDIQREFNLTSSGK